MKAPNKKYDFKLLVATIGLLSMIPLVYLLFFREYDKSAIGTLDMIGDCNLYLVTVTELLLLLFFGLLVVAVAGKIKSKLTPPILNNFR
tara:strand:- start:220 stop:486 length:267 start_codon:yes stop_codon:yes gene_type:complete